MRSAGFWAAIFLTGAGLCIAINGPDWPAVFAGHLDDPDSYMRLERILQGIAQGHLVNRVARDDSGAGVMVEWSKLLDGVLLVLAAPMAIFAGWRQALFAAGAMLGPIGVGLLGLAFAFAAKPFSERKYLWAAPVAAALLPGLQAFALPGMVHYHILLLVLIALTAGLVVRSWRGDPGWAFLAGLAGGAAIWLTPETMPFVLMAFTALLFRWLETPIGSTLLGCAAGFIDMLIFGFAIDPPEGGYAVMEIDRLSLVYVLLGLLLLAGALVLWRMATWPPRRRRVCGMALMLALLLGWIALFPKVALGPYGVMGAADRRAFYGAITEQAPAQNLAALAGFLLPGLLALLFSAVKAVQGGNRAWLWAWISVCAAVALCLGVKFVLFVEFPSGLAAALLPVMLTDIGAWAKNLPWRRWFVQGALLCLMLVVPRLPLAAGPKTSEPPASPSCDLLHINNLLAPYAGDIVLADVSITPELLYRTGIVTVGSLYQHGVPAFLRLRAAWRSLPGNSEPPSVAATKAQFILFCPIQGRTELVDGLPPDTLWDALEAGKPPLWLTQVAADRQTGWQLFRLP